MPIKTLVTLAPDQTYSLETSSLHYMFRSGSLGPVSISSGETSVVIKDDKGNTVFSWKKGQDGNSRPREQVTFEDTDGSTVVKIITEDKEQAKGAGDGPQRAAAGATRNIPKPPRDNNRGTDTNRTGNRNEGPKKRSASPPKPDIPNKRQNVYWGVGGINMSNCVISSGVDFGGSSFESNWQSWLPQGNGWQCSSSVIGGSGSSVSTNNGHVVVRGSGNSQLAGNMQSVRVEGSGQLILTGNVEHGVVMSGTGTITIYGNVRGGIRMRGLRGSRVVVAGDVYGDINFDSEGSLTVEGRHRNGRLLRNGRSGNVWINNLDHHYY